MTTNSLRSFGEEIWTVEQPSNFMGLPLGLRMTVIRLPEQRLLIHSPVPCSDELEQSISDLGEICYLIAPNCEHTRFINAWQQHYPVAQLFAPAIKEIEQSLPLDDNPLPWHNEGVESLLVAGMPRLQETVFFHHQSGTLILTDLAFNLGGEMSLWAKTFLRLNGAYERFTPSRLLKSLIKDKSAFGNSIEQIMQWDFNTIIMAHGTPVTADAREHFIKAFGWVL